MDSHLHLWAAILGKPRVRTLVGVLVSVLFFVDPSLILLQTEVSEVFKGIMHSLLTLRKRKRSFKACSSFVQRLAVITTKCPLSASPTCFQT
jgi:hypothetical protein